MTDAAIIAAAAIYLGHGKPDLMYVGPRSYRMFQWEAQERDRWAGRDWRRIKRERRKFMAEGRA